MSDMPVNENTCYWTLTFDGHFNISCDSGERANGDFKGAKWEFKFCPYCGREIKDVFQDE